MLDAFIARALSEPWLIRADVGARVYAALARRHFEGRLPPDVVRAAVGDAPAAAEACAASTRTEHAGGAVAVIPVYGLVMHRAYQVREVSTGTCTSAEVVGAALRRALADSSVAAVVLDIDSPGGGIGGIPELAALIASAEKPVIAVANSLAASAAYWIAAACDEVVVVPSGDVGSIGVFVIHENRAGWYATEGVEPEAIASSPEKVELADWGPLSDEARAFLSADVARCYGEFVAAVARGRGVTPKRVREEFGKGRCVAAEEAVRLGMADRIGTLEETVSRLATGRGARRRAAMELGLLAEGAVLAPQAGAEDVRAQDAVPVTGGSTR